MSREIKFRVWVKPFFEDGVMEYKGYMVEKIHSLNFTKVTSMIGCTPIGISYYEPGIYYGRLIHLKSDEFELMEFTGLRDSKRNKEFPEGQEIYEGDICRNNGTLIGEVVFHKSAWMIRWKSGNHYPLGDFAEVIGNIYENHKLDDDPHDES